MMRSKSVFTVTLLVITFLFPSNSFSQPTVQNSSAAVATQPTLDNDPRLRAIFNFILERKDPELISKLLDFLKVYHEVRLHYVDDKTSKDLMDLAMKGMVEGLDPYSHLFVNEEAAEMLKNFSERNYDGGIGVTISRLDKNIFISEVFEGYSASKAGLESGDIILSVDGKSVYGMDTTEIVGLVKGPNGTTVSLEIRSRRLQSPRTFSLVRQTVVIKSIVYRDLDRKNGYIKVRGFTPETTDEFRDVLNRVRDSNKEGLVIDLRNNGGGSVTAVTDMLGYLLGPDQLITIFKERYSEEAVFTRTLKVETLHLKKIVVLVNNFSASASEIMSGALKHYKAATVMGVRTFGKATAQNYLDLDVENHVPNEKTRLLMGVTTARYLLPDRTDISRSGVQPDIEVEQADDFRAYEYLTKRDRQLQEAIKFLKR